MLIGNDCSIRSPNLNNISSKFTVKNSFKFRSWLACSTMTFFCSIKISSTLFSRNITMMEDTIAAEQALRSLSNHPFTKLKVNAKINPQTEVLKAVTVPCNNAAMPACMCSIVLRFKFPRPIVKPIKVPKTPRPVNIPDILRTIVKETNRFSSRLFFSSDALKYSRGFCVRNAS